MLDADSEISRDDALAQPSRTRLFRLLAELRRAASTKELAARLDMHPNGVRIHLERLHAAGLVTRTRVRGPRGRPADVWTVAPEARPGGHRPGAYRDLCKWLARSIAARSTSPRDLERTGRAIGRELASSDAAQGPEAVERALAALGFAPLVQSRKGDRLTIRLGNCPYRDVVRENQPAICALHKGITRGLLDMLAPGTKLDKFVPHDPVLAGCLVELVGAPAAH
jgi:predicted ArsR family transcriptional regulator